jgi:hypothetical protein
LLAKRGSSEEDSTKLDAILHIRQFDLLDESEGAAPTEGAKEDEVEIKELMGQRCVLYCFFPGVRQAVGQAFSLDLTSTVEGFFSSSPCSFSNFLIFHIT